MAKNSDDLDLDPTETPVIFGLWQLIPSDEPKPPPPPNPIIKYMAKAFNAISMPVTYLFYFGNKIPLAYTRLQQMYIILLTLIIPAALFCLNYFYIAKKIKKIPTKPSVGIPRKPSGCRSTEPTTSTEEGAEDIPDEKKKWDDYNKSLVTWESYDYKMKPWNEYYAKLKAYADSVQDRSVSYMICIWMVMFAVLVGLFPRLENPTK
jgi:hypothetical protein